MEDSIPNLKISQLRAFVAVAELGNFSTAALELGLTQSTISHAIASLEEELGVILLSRGRHGATLTPVGDQLIDDARQVLQVLVGMQKKANLTKSLESGQVRLSSVRSVGTHVLPEVIAEFRRAFPTVQVVLTERDRYAEIEQALRDGIVDIGFTLLPTSDDFESWELFRDEFVALLPPESSDPKTPLTWEELLTYSMILNPAIAPYHTKMVRDHLAKFDHALPIAYEVKEDSTILGMVQRGLGAAIMPRMAAEPIPEGIIVKSLPVPLERTIGVVVLADALLTPATFAFLDILRNVWRRKKGQTAKLLEAG